MEDRFVHTYLIYIRYNIQCIALESRSVGGPGSIHNPRCSLALHITRTSRHIRYSIDIRFHSSVRAKKRSSGNKAEERIHSQWNQAEKRRRGIIMHIYILLIYTQTNLKKYLNVQQKENRVYYLFSVSDLSLLPSYAVPPLIFSSPSCHVFIISSPSFHLFSHPCPFMYPFLSSHLSLSSFFLIISSHSQWYCKQDRNLSTGHHS